MLLSEPFQDSFNITLSQQLTHDISYISRLTLSLVDFNSHHCLLDKLDTKCVIRRGNYRVRKKQGTVVHLCVYM